MTYAYTTNLLRSKLTLAHPNASDWVQTYAYDFARRLTNATSPAGPFAYDWTTTEGGGLGLLHLKESNLAYGSTPE